MELGYGTCNLHYGTCKEGFSVSKAHLRENGSLCPNILEAL